WYDKDQEEGVSVIEARQHDGQRLFDLINELNEYIGRDDSLIFGVLPNSESSLTSINFRVIRNTFPLSMDPILYFIHGGSRYSTLVVMTKCLFLPWLCNLDNNSIFHNLPDPRRLPLLLAFVFT
ncbi:hypothetical protein ACJX0J_039618, partial [Zea mays]